MHLDLVELLRCVEQHEDTWLVAAIDRLEGREIVAGTLGCPICHAEYGIRDRVVYFTPACGTTRTGEPDVSQAMRIAAALELSDPRATTVLHGGWTRHARLVHSLSPAPLLALDSTVTVEPDDGVNVVVSDVAPFARRSIRGIAVDADATPALTASLLAALRPGGRVIAPVALPLPDGLTELARDDDVWVAELPRDDVIPLRRGGNHR